jgi:zinc protease
MLNRTKAPTIKNAVDFNFALKNYTLYTLNNGVKVYAIHAGQQDVFQIEWLFEAGNMYEEKTGVSAVTNMLLQNGTTTKTAFEINELFEYYGLQCNRSCYNEGANITLSGLSKHIPPALPLIAELITQASFTQTELDIYKQNATQRLKVNLTKSDFVANRLVDTYLYGEAHPYGKSISLADIQSYTTDELKTFYNKHYVNGSLVIFMCGILPENIAELLNQHFGNLPLQPLQYKPCQVPATPAAQKKHRVTIDEAGVQGAIRLARPFYNRHHADFMQTAFLNIVYGGYFGSRLMSNIREEKGYTYGIHSYLQNHLGNGAWLISTEAGKDVAEATIQEVYNEMETLRNTLVDDEELMTVKNYMLGSILGDLDGPFQILGRWKNIILNNLDESYFYASVNNIKNITAKELQVMANKYLNPSDFYELVVI